MNHCGNYSTKTMNTTSKNTHKDNHATHSDLVY